MSASPLTVVEISRSALRHQVRSFKKRIGSVSLYPVIKSNAYGHGMSEVVSVLDAEKSVAGYMVVSVDEALSIRKKTKKKILVLSIVPKDAHMVEQAIRSGISLPVYDVSMARWLDALAKRVTKKARVHIKIDVGTMRLGFRHDDTTSLNACMRLPHLKIEGIFSHFADSENSDEAFTREQQRRFDVAISHMHMNGHTSIQKHIACSAAILRSPHYDYDIVRLGISLYGLWPSHDMQKMYSDALSLDPVLCWKTKVIQVKEIRAGETIGYGRSYTAQTAMRLAVIPVGYWDGYDRKLSNQGEVLIGGKRCKIRGRVCMNLTMVEVPLAQKIKSGDEVVLIGRQGKERIAAEELARIIGTINYEVTTRINPLITRRIVS